MGSLTTIRKKCCCDDGKNFVIECFPQMCEDGPGLGWRNFFAYSAGDIADNLRFFVRVPEEELEKLRRLGWPDRDFVWWDHAVDSPQRSGGGQLWQLRRDPVERIKDHKDFLFGNNETSLPQDPRAFRSGSFPNGLQPPPNAFIFQDEDGNEIVDDGVLSTNFSLGRADPFDDGFFDQPKRITGSQYDNFLADGISGPFDAEFSLVDFNDVDITIDPDTGDVTGTVLGEGWKPDGFPFFPRLQRVSHLFHHIWNTSFTNFQNFKQGNGIDPTTGEIIASEPGAYQPTSPGATPDDPLNIYFWQRWILHSHPQAPFRQLKFAVTCDVFNSDREYEFSTLSYDQAPPCDTSYQDAIDGFNDGTFNCNTTRATSGRSWPTEGHIAQNYNVLVAGTEFAIVANGVYEWPRPDGSAPDFPDGLRDESANNTAAEECADPTLCNTKWGLQPASVRSARINFQQTTTQTKVLGATLQEMIDEDTFGIVVSSGDLNTLSTFGGSLDHYDDVRDITGDFSQRRVFQWPTEWLGLKNNTFNVCGQSSIGDCCGTGSGEGLNTFIGLPETVSHSIKFRICDMLNETMEIDTHNTRGPDEGAVVAMSGDIFSAENYLPLGIDMQEIWSRCGTYGLRPTFRQSDTVSNLVEIGGFWRVRSNARFLMNFVSANTPTGCTPGPCNFPNLECDSIGCQQTATADFACRPDQTCGEFAGFTHNLNVNAGGAKVTASMTISTRGIFSRGLEPPTTYGTVDF